MNTIETLSQPQGVSMADEWFQFATADHFWMQWRHCLLVRALRRAGGQIRTTLEMARPGKGHLFVYNILDQEPSLLGRYDAVFLLDVIEHIDDDVSFLRAALRHLQPDGLVVVNVPASMLLFSDYDRAAGHVRRYTPGGLRKLLHSCGVETQAVQSWGMLMVPLLLARKALLGGTKRANAIQTGFVPPNAIARRLLHGMKNVEIALPFKMPFGTSILAWGRLHPQRDV